MLQTVLLATLLFSLSGLVHVSAMGFVMKNVQNWNLPRSVLLLFALYILSAAHVAEAAVYAIGFAFGERAGLGGFVQEDVDTFMDVFYFSIVNYTSLGLGDIYPSGHLRFLAGIESLNGFLLISCSASLVFTVVTKRANSVV